MHRRGLPGGSGLTHIIGLTAKAQVAGGLCSKTTKKQDSRHREAMCKAEQKPKQAAIAIPFHQLMPSVSLSPCCCVTLASDTSAEAFMLVVQMEWSSIPVCWASACGSSYQERFSRVSICK